jgi:hypothetical protein
MEEMLALLREVGMPPMLIGAMRQALKGMPEAKAREMCARVGVGMLNVALGGNVKASLDPYLLTDDEALADMIEKVRAGKVSELEESELVDTLKAIGEYSEPAEGLWVCSVCGEPWLSDDEMEERGFDYCEGSKPELTLIPAAQ